MAEVSIVPIRIDNEPGLAAMTSFLAEQQETLCYPTGCTRLLAGVAIEGYREDGPYEPAEAGPIVGAFTMGLAPTRLEDLTDHEFKPTLEVKIGRVVLGESQSRLETIIAFGDFAATRRLVALADQGLPYVRADPANVTSIIAVRKMTVEPREQTTQDFKLVVPVAAAPTGELHSSQ